MKLSWAVLLLVVQAAHFQRQTSSDVACAYERKNSCSLCPYDEGRQDFTRCAGDCQLEGAGDRRVCVPKAVNCGQKRESECSRCPFPQNADGVIQNMALCQGDCEVKTRDNTPYCALKDVVLASTTQAPTIPIGSHPNYPLPIDFVDSNSASITPPNYLIPYVPDSFLAVVTVEISNSNRQWPRPSKIRFYVEVCAGYNCCETGEMYQRAGLFKFSEDFQNLGECRQFRRDTNEAVRVTAKKVGRENTHTPLKVLTITAQFDDGSLMVAEDVSGSWYGQTQRSYLQWEVSRDMIETQVEESINLPPAQCPEIWTATANACPKTNVRVHERLRDARKFCYYQVCTTFTADLSTVQNEQLGSGGYCVPKRQKYPQYKYCCDLEQYFTHPDGNATPRQGVNFPRCQSMNNTRNDI